MQIFHSYGESGLGDFVSSTSFFLTHHFHEDSHIVFHLPIEKRQYEQRICDVMSMWENIPYKLTYEFDCSGAHRPISKAHNEFIKISNFKQYKFLYRHDVICTKHLYWPCIKKWKANNQGAIAIYNNHEYRALEVQSKFFNKQDSKTINALIDNKNYFGLGKEHSFEENLEILSNCRYAIGLEGGWTHVANSMRVPYIVCANQRPWNKILQHHSAHPNFKIIDTVNMFDYLNTKRPSKAA